MNFPHRRTINTWREVFRLTEAFGNGNCTVHITSLESLEMDGIVRRGISKWRLAISPSSP
jgi:hypothetical protein